MIAGVILRNFKTYRGLNYLPLSNGSNYCGLIGLNGIGKSSILEALECFFNNIKKWNRNMDANKAEQSYVMPVFIFEKGFFRDKEQSSFAEKYSDTIRTFIGNEIPTTIHIQRKYIWEQIKKQLETFPLDDNSLIIPVGIDENGVVVESIIGDIFDYYEKIDYPWGQNADKERIEYNQRIENRNEKIKNYLTSLIVTIKDVITYIYIPKDIEPERFVKFETEEIQHLIGSNLVDIVKKQLTRTEIDDISRNLRAFIDNLSNSLPNYMFKTKSSRQPNLKSKDIYELIVHDFFSKRELYKTNNSKEVPLSLLSSGEKQQAITTLIHSAVLNYRKDNKNLIIAIDEPESALHVSKCFEQFQKLYEISELCNQVIFSSHWYGFIPAIPRGCVSNIVRKEEKHDVAILDIYNYREEIRNGIRNNQGNFPIDITLKGINDLVQSIISSVINKETHYNWLICEGSSDKIYLEEYLKEEIKNIKLRIIPVSGIGYIEKIYKQLCLAFQDLNTDIVGKVFMLGDTDAQLHTFDIQKIKNLECKRIVKNDNNENVSLVDMNSRDTGKTDIEDALNGKVFKIALNKFKENNEELAFLDAEPVDEKNSFYAMNLQPSNYKKLELFFSKNKNENKVMFAKVYVEELTKADYRIPSWILDIKGFFNSPQ